METKSLILAEQICAGELNAFKEFFFDNQPKVFRFLYRYTHDSDIAEDLTQETFINFWKAKERLDPQRPIKYFLFRIARNLALNYLMRTPHVLRYSNDEDNSLIALAKNPQLEYERYFLMDDFQKAIDTLPERCRAIFILSRYHNLSYNEIAETLEISLQTVKNQINKAIAILRKKLSSYID